MKNLLELIQEEGVKNNYLKDALKEGAFPNEEVAKELGSEALYHIAKNSVEFNTRISIEIIKSNHYFVKLVERYIAECKEGHRVAECDVNIMSHWTAQYTKEAKAMTDNLVRQQMKGYEGSW